MNRNEFLRELEKLMECREGSLEEQLELQSLEQWDSMQMLAFIAFVQSRLDIVVEGQRVATAKKVLDLLELVQAKLDH